MKVSRSIAIAAAAALSFVGAVQAGPVIDGTISSGEWAGAATYTIGNGGGTAYLKADTSYVYGAFDITGWTESDLGNTTNGFLMGFGAWKANGGYGTSPGVEFQQANNQAAWGGDGNSGTLNGLVSAWRKNTVLQAGIDSAVQSANSFGTGHRVWEMRMPISSMGVSAGDTIYVVGGINYGGQVHWYPDYFPNGFTNYAPVTVEGAVVPLPAAAWSGLALLGSVGAVNLLRKRRNAAVNA